MDDELIRVCALATRAACRRMTQSGLKALHDSVEQACYLPKGLGWDRKAAAHAQIVNLLADTAEDPVLALLVRDAPGQLHDLMIAAGPASDDVIAGSRARLLTLIQAQDAEGAAREMERHVGGLFQLRASRGRAPADIVL